MTFAVVGGVVLVGTSSCPVACSVAGRLVFPAPPSTFHRCRLGPRGLPARAALPSPKLGDVGRRGLLPLLQSSPHLAGTPRNPCRSSGLEFLLSWHYPLVAPPLFNHPRVHSQRLRRASFGPSVPPDSSCSVLVVSHHLDGFLRATAAGLLHPAASLEVRRVSRFPVPERHPKVTPATMARSPQRGSYPSKGSPHQQPYRITAAVALLPVERRPPRSCLGSDAKSKPAGSVAPKCWWLRSAAPAEAVAANLLSPKRLQRDAN